MHFQRAFGHKFHEHLCQTNIVEFQYISLVIDWLAHNTNWRRRYGSKLLHIVENVYDSFNWIKTRLISEYISRQRETWQRRSHSLDKYADTNILNQTYRSKLLPRKSCITQPNWRTGSHLPWYRSQEYKFTYYLQNMSKGFDKIVLKVFTFRLPSRLFCGRHTINMIHPIIEPAVTDLKGEWLATPH